MSSRRWQHLGPASTAAVMSLAFAAASAQAAPAMHGDTQDEGATIASAEHVGPSYLPDFLADDDISVVQASQTRMYLRTRAPEQLWADHVQPLLADRIVADTTAGTASTSQDLEALREQLDAYYSDIGSLLDTVRSADRLDAMERLEAAQAALAQMSAEELFAIDEAFRPFPGMWDAPELALELVQGGPALAQLEAQTQAIPRAGSSEGPAPQRGAALLPELAVTDAIMQAVVAPNPLPAVPSSAVDQWDNCADFAENSTCAGCPPSPAGGIATVFALQTVAFTASAVCSYFDGDVFPVTGAEIPNPLKIACSVATTALQIVADSVEFAYNLNGSCEQGFHRSILHAYLDVQVSTRATQKSHDFHRLWELRVAIENALLLEGDQRVALFQLPASEGGFLDAEDDLSVRFIVRDTIDMNGPSGAGYDVRNAEAEYDAAIAHLDAGEYKDAFARFRLAYRAAVRVGRVPVE